MRTHVAGLKKWGKHRRSPNTASSTERETTKRSMPGFTEFFGQIDLPLSLVSGREAQLVRLVKMLSFDLPCFRFTTSKLVICGRNTISTTATVTISYLHTLKV